MRIQIVWSLLYSASLVLQSYRPKPHYAGLCLLTYCGFEIFLCPIFHTMRGPPVMISFMFITNYLPIYYLYYWIQIMYKFISRTGSQCVHQQVHTFWDQKRILLGEIALLEDFGAVLCKHNKIALERGIALIIVQMADATFLVPKPKPHWREIHVRRNRIRRGVSVV